jgi:hypothetical protein
MGDDRIRTVLRAAAAAPTVLLLVAVDAWAQDLKGDVEALRGEVAELKRHNQEMQRQLSDALMGFADLRAEQAAARASSPRLPLGQASAPPPAAGGGGLGSSRVRLVDVSLVADIAAGLSSERDEEIQLLQFGGHDPKQRGFTLQQVELSLMGAVDPYFTGEAHIIYFLDPEGESQFEIEEAFLTTQALPHGLQLEVGQFFTEFGRINPVHPHAWHWMDQPLILSRVFGADNMRGVGTRLGWLSELPWYSEFHLGVQNARGETMASFLSSEEAETVGGRTFVDREVQRLDDLVYLARWYNAWDPTETISAGVGLSALFGPNSTGPNGTTRIYGTDLVVKWRPATQRRGWPFVVFESEVIRRDYKADDDPDPNQPLPSETLQDWGMYAQGLWGFIPRWAAGFRVEYASGSGASVEGREADPLRDDRLRLSPLIAFYPSEFSRIRLQYNFDRADHIARRDTAHSLWLGFEFGIGAHPAHRF